MTRFLGTVRSLLGPYRALEGWRYFFFHVRPLERGGFPVYLTQFAPFPMCKMFVADRPGRSETRTPPPSDHLAYREIIFCRGCLFFELWALIQRMAIFKASPSHFRQRPPAGSKLASVRRRPPVYARAPGRFSKPFRPILHRRYRQQHQRTPCRSPLPRVP